MKTKESDELEELKGLQTIYLNQFHGFYEDQTVRDISGDSDDEDQTVRDISGDSDSEGSMSLQNAGQF